MYQTCQFEHCNNQFECNKKRMFCSRRCSNLSRWNADSQKGRTINKSCVYCGKQWTTTRSEDFRRGYKTCSDECRSAQIGVKLKNRTFSEESRRKMSKSQRSKTLTEEHRTNIGKGVSGSRNRFWKDGRSYDKDDYGGLFTETLKTTVRRRDGNLCQECKTPSDTTLHVHHIDCNKLNNDTNNLISLCQNCHSIIHSTKGYVPNNPKLISLA
jgi:hypothetical protein